ncbi:hypothetical protein BKA61DRAFT_678523 [Leptodontidium sp. MPI-SDFR-AT-0119]|nr:hypothetical protein BKA61DRAFT_678523 [Leptodontidium sp. MPI-SDFR-AT-0119]
MADTRRQKRPREGSIEEFQHVPGSKTEPNYGTSPTEPCQPAEQALKCYPPLSGYDIDRLNHHIDLEEFGKSLQEAANAVFSEAGNRRSRYSNVSVILLSWEDEDPNLPVSLEIAALKDVFVNLYGFEAKEWQIPNLNSHTALNLRILQFLAEADSNGVAELLAACAFNNTTNGVGPFSFTHVLTPQLQNLASRPSFTIGYLYNLIFGQVQALPVKSAEYRKPPIHLALTQDHRLPRSITLSCRKREKQDIPDMDMDILEAHTDQYDVRDAMDRSSPSEESDKAPDSSPLASSSESPATSLSHIPEYPRLLFSIRMSEDINPRSLSPDLFADWLSALPMEAKSVRVEAGFASDSTLLMVSMPIALMGYLPRSEAITLLGTTRSRNLLSTGEEGSEIPKIAVIKDQNVELEDVSMEEESRSPSQECLKEEPDAATPRPIDTLPDSSLMHMDMNISPTQEKFASPLSTHYWAAHLVKQKRPSQINSIYSRWTMEKLEVVARSVVAAYHVRKQDEQMSLLKNKMDGTGISPTGLKTEWGDSPEHQVRIMRESMYIDSKDTYSRGGFEEVSTQ